MGKTVNGGNLISSSQILQGAIDTLDAAELDEVYKSLNNLPQLNKMTNWMFYDLWNKKDAGNLWFISLLRITGHLTLAHDVPRGCYIRMVYVTLTFPCESLRIELFTMLDARRELLQTTSIKQHGRFFLAANETVDSDDKSHQDEREQKPAGTYAQTRGQ